MTLAYLLIIALIMSAISRVSVYSLLHNTALFFHHKCIDRLPVESLARPELQALVCGAGFAQPQISQNYISVGLIHLFVVSGAHLLLLEKILGFTCRISIKKSPLILFLILSLYTLACQLNPPVTRSFVSLVISFFLKKNHLNWPTSYKLFLIGLCTLCLNPEWVSSISFQLSWIAGLMFSISSIYFKNRHFLFKHYLFFFCLYPILIFLSIPNPLSILVNLIATPILELILFPLALLTWFLPFLYVLFDPLIHFLNLLIQAFEFRTHAQTDLLLTQLPILGWSLILCFHLYLHLFEMNYRRKFYE